MHTHSYIITVRNKDVYHQGCQNRCKIDLRSEWRIIVQDNINISSKRQLTNHTKTVMLWLGQTAKKCTIFIATQTYFAPEHTIMESLECQKSKIDWKLFLQKRALSYSFPEEKKKIFFSFSPPELFITGRQQRQPVVLNISRESLNLFSVERCAYRDSQVIFFCPVFCRVLQPEQYNSL